MKRIIGRVRFTATASGNVGLALVAIIVLVALVGPVFAPEAPDKPIAAPFSEPTGDALLGTDFLGRDVLARVLWGGRSVLVLAGLATFFAYVAGLLIGLVAGYSRSLLDPLLMRGVDVLLSFPALIFLLVLITGLGTGTVTLVLGVALIQVPSVARIIRSATLEQSVRGFVEAAVARGERTSAILWREILPNLVGPISADAGLRLAYSVIIIASVNFLGLGLKPPAADWGLMISENRQGITLNPWVILVPASLIALLTISLNLVGDSLARRPGRSGWRG